ncbi:Phosphoserine phosphatase RsbU [Polystyrenella longa]|uniref:Phosphoserine phosphatase RsbU n=1 Tax=Polystyrenella longa TaxID=2528007 RepID=A0A518CPD0_9PLAN|nr:PP2C family protein-serine/threonine phosphatase [Polystyrenella longa]QDU81086.1 Phosphoserine phosphatase RsbU [Polystyrenella longa]
MNHGLKISTASVPQRQWLDPDFLAWIQSNCSELRKITGWPVHFVPSQQNSTEKEPQAPVQEHCWVTEVNDGETRVGHLRVDLPDIDPPECSFQTMREMVELTSKLLSACSVRQRLSVTYAQELSTLVSLDFTCSTEMNLIDRLSSILDVAIELSGYKEAGFYLLEPENSCLKLRVRTSRASFRIPQTQRELTVDSADVEIFSQGSLLVRRNQESEYEESLPHDAAVGFGLVVKSETGPLGTVWFWDRRDKVPTEREIHVLQSISTQIAQMLEKVVLMKESAVQRRMQHDLIQASACQPEQIVQYQPENGLWEAAGICTSRFELGGDVFELIALDEHHTLIAVGDASGDSVPAAMIMSTVRGALRSLASSPIEELMDPAAIMYRVNNVLCELTPSHQFMSMLIGILDTSENCFRYSNAGHPTPFYSRDCEVEALQSHGVLLGVMEDAEYDYSELSLRPQSLLVFYSDGISEAMNDRKKLFHSEGIVRGLKGCLLGTAQEVFEEIWANMEGHSQGADEPDDRTLVILRMLSDSE